MKIVEKILDVISFILGLGAIACMIAALVMAYNQNDDAIGFMIFTVFLAGLGYVAKEIKKI